MGLDGLVGLGIVLLVFGDLFLGLKISIIVVFKLIFCKCSVKVFFVWLLRVVLMMR